MQFKVLEGSLYSIDTISGLRTLVMPNISAPPVNDMSHPYILSPSATSSIERMQAEEYRQHFNENGEHEGSVLSTQLKISELSLGLYDTALKLYNSDVCIYVDDSGSMTMSSDVLVSEPYEVSPDFKARYEAAKTHEKTIPAELDRFGRPKKLVSTLISNDGLKLSRWGEAANRLFIFVNELTCLPTGDIEISFFNRDAVITISEDLRRTLSLEEFKQTLLDQIWAQFCLEPTGGTPLLKVVNGAFTSTKLLSPLTVAEFTLLKTQLSSHQGLHYDIRRKLKSIDVSHYKQVKFSKVEQEQIEQAMSAHKELNAIQIKLLKEQTRDAAHVLLTDGEPSDCRRHIHNTKTLYLDLIEIVRTRGLGYGLTFSTVDEAASLAIDRAWKEKISPERLAEIRQASEKNSLMLLSCTNETLTYFDTLDEDSINVDSMDDYRRELQQVQIAHGPQFPYTLSVWVLKQLVGSKSKLLDALDEKRKIFTKEAYELFTGYLITDEAFTDYIRYKKGLRADLTWVDPMGNESPMVDEPSVTVSTGNYQGSMFGNNNPYRAPEQTTYHEDVQGTTIAPLNSEGGCCSMM